MIYLKKDYRTKSGNFYSKGKYNSLDELPKELQGSELLDIKKPEVEVEILKKKDIVEFVFHADIVLYLKMARSHVS